MEFCPCNKPCGLENTEIDINNKVVPCTNFKFICEEGKPICLNDVEKDGDGDRNVNYDNKCEDPKETPVCINNKLEKIPATKVCKNFGKHTANCEPTFYEGKAQCGKFVQNCSLLKNPLTMPPTCSCKNCGLKDNCKFTCSKGKPMCKNIICQQNEQPWCKEIINGKLVSYNKAKKECYIKDPNCFSTIKNGRLVCEGPCNEKFSNIFYNKTKLLSDNFLLILFYFILIVLLIIVMKK